MVSRLIREDLFKTDEVLVSIFIFLEFIEDLRVVEEGLAVGNGDVEFTLLQLLQSKFHVFAQLVALVLLAQQSQEFVSSLLSGLLLSGSFLGITSEKFALDFVNESLGFLSTILLEEVDE
jgi:hypothetical protein